MQRFTFAVRILVAMAIAIASGPLHAQAFPDRPIRIIFPFPAGAVSDYMIRLVAEAATPELGTSVIVENRSGGVGIPGTEAAARSAPDGYTVLFVANSFANNPIVRKDLPYDTDRDFDPLMLIGSTPLVLTVHASVPAETTEQLVALLKEKPGQLNFGAAPGVSQHLAMEWFKRAADVSVVHIPYRGAGQVLPDLMAGRLQLVFNNVNDSAPHVKTGKLKILGITTPKRSPLAPDVRTLAEAGYPGPAWDSFYGLVLPAKTPKPIVDKLSAAFSAAVKKPDVQSKMAAVGFQPAGGTPAEFKAFLQEARASSAKIIRDADIRIQ